MLIVAEELLILLTDHATGTKRSASGLDAGIGGALLVDLARARRITFTGPVARAKVEVVDPAPTAHPVLAAALAELTHQRVRRASRVVPGLGSGAPARLYAALAERGVVRRESGRRIGIFPTTRWPVLDTTNDRAVRYEVYATLVQGAAPTERAAAHAALLAALGELGQVVGHAHLKQAKRRAQEILEHDPAARAVKAAVQASQAVMVAGVSS